MSWKHAFEDRVNNLGCNATQQVNGLQPSDSDANIGQAKAHPETTEDIDSIGNSGIGKFN